MTSQDHSISLICLQGMFIGKYNPSVRWNDEKNVESELNIRREILLARLEDRISWKYMGDLYAQMNHVHEKYHSMNNQNGHIHSNGSA